VNPRAVQVALLFEHDIATIPCEDLDKLDGLSLWTGCRRYHCPDMDSSLIALAEKAEDDD
jgi:hypothetical protein